MLIGKILRDILWHKYENMGDHIVTGENHKTFSIIIQIFHSYKILNKSANIAWVIAENVDGLIREIN